MENLQDKAQMMLGQHIRAYHPNQPIRLGDYICQQEVQSPAHFVLVRNTDHTLRIPMLNVSNNNDDDDDGISCHFIRYLLLLSTY